jgi:CRP-like cAMP-binding protein
MQNASNIQNTPAIQAELSKSYLFKDFSPSEMSAVLHLGTREVLNPGDELMSRGEVSDAFYLVHYGSVRTHLAGPEGKIEVTTLVGNGGLIGVVGAVAGQGRVLGAEIVERTELFAFSWSVLEKYLAQHHDAAYKLHRALSQHLAQSLMTTVLELVRVRETCHLAKQSLSAL